MKTWIFALLESLIAVLGLVAYFWADNLLLATLAVVAAALVGIAQPLIAAQKARQLEQYQDQQYQQSLDALEGQLQQLACDAIDPPAPHRATVAAVLGHRYGQRAAALLAEYDAVIEALQAGARGDAAAARFAAHVSPWSVASYLRGLAALAADKLQAAHSCFTAATEQQSSWILPWLGWATTACRLGRWDEIRERHPHLCGVELLPYGAGDEDTFLEIAERDREELTAQFQAAATSLGNYYTVAELSRSKQQMAAQREQYKKVA